MKVLGASSGIAALVLLVAMWLVALRWYDGVLVACVDCTGEGWVELVVLVAGLVVAGVALALLVEDRA